MAKNRGNFHIDWVFLLTVLCLIIIGLFTIYSTGYNQKIQQTEKNFYLQLVWFAIGVFFFLLTISTSYHKYVEWAMYLYGIGLVLLLAVLVIGKGIKGGGVRSWLVLGPVNFQPSEIMKLFTIIIMAKFLNVLGSEIKNLRNFFISFIIVLPPLGLILIQPDFGTALVFAPICLAMLFIAGAKVSHIGSLLTLSGLGVGIPLIVAYYKETGKMTGWFIQILANNNILITISVVLSIIALIAFMINFFVRTRVFIKFALALVIIPIGFSSAVIINSYLKPYQRKRIVIFIDPERDYYGAGFNIIQSKIAIGSGGLTGKGYLKGPQNQLSFLPEKRTDFVFSSFGEEWGFIGSMLLMGLYFLLIYRGVMIIYHARDMLGSLIATGIMGMFVFHIFINIGMATGMMPVTGLPLPFISYGGSSLLTNLIAIGLLFNIEMRRYVH